MSTNGTETYVTAAGDARAWPVLPKRREAWCTAHRSWHTAAGALGS
jgi:hypothetical protein